MSAQPLIIPSKFTAVDDGLSSTINRIGRGADIAAQKFEAFGARSERAFRKVTPGLSTASKQLLSMVGTAAAVGAAFSIGRASIQSIMDYETAVQSFRTIVSDLNDTDFSKYKIAIGKVASDTRKSTIDVAASFEKIAGLNAKFAQTAEGISQVSNAAITLSKASGDELGPSAESLVGIMNQFSFAANQADRTINVLAAGQAVGAASITQTADAFTTFGSTAAGANVTIEQSVGLIETLGKFSLFGSEAGTQLKGSLIRLQKAGVGYNSGQFKINDALEEMKVKFDKLKTAKEKDAFITDKFGLINIGVGRILLNNIDTYKEFTQSVTGTTEAQKAAAINSNTLSNRIAELKNRWVNMLTSTNAASDGLNKAKNIIGYLTDHMDEIVSVGIGVLKFFAVWKASIMAVRLVTGAFNIALGLQGALTGIASIAIGKSSIALNAYGIATKAATAFQWLLNVAMGANPIGALIIGVVALGAALLFLSNRHAQLIEEYKKEIALDTIKQKDQETKSVNNLARSYEQLGMSKKQALATSIAFERQSIQMEQSSLTRKIAENRQTIKENSLVGGGKIFGEFSAERKKAESELVANTKRARQLSDRNLDLSEMTAGAVDSGLFDRKTGSGILNSKFNNATYVKSPEKLNADQVEQNRINKISQLEEQGMSFGSTKVAQAQTNTITNTNNAESKVEVTFKNDSNNQVNVAGFSKAFNVMPQTTSTLSTQKR